MQFGDIWFWNLIIIFIYNFKFLRFYRYYSSIAIWRYKPLFLKSKLERVAFELFNYRHLVSKCKGYSNLNILVNNINQLKSINLPKYGISLQVYLKCLINSSLNEKREYAWWLVNHPVVVHYYSTYIILVLFIPILINKQVVEACFYIYIV